MDRKSRYFVVTHFYADGPAQFLNKYFFRKNTRYLYIEHPFIFSNRNYSLYQNNLGKKLIMSKGKKVPKIEFLYYLKDFITTVIEGLKYNFDIGIGFDNLNTLALLVLKKLNRVKKVIYVTVDYTPVRFKNNILNNIYHWIDRVCCYDADILWDSAEVMQEARKTNSVLIEKIKNKIVVPDGNDFEKEKIQEFENIGKYRLVYMGHVRENQGIELLIKAVITLHKKDERIKLLIIGGGKLLNNFKSYVIKNNVGSYIEFTGYVDNHKKIEELLKRSYLGFALYEDNSESYSKYSAVGKPLVYMGCGLPVIITAVPEIARKIDSFGAGKIVEYNKEKIVEVVEQLIENKSLYLQMKKKAIEFAGKNTWEQIFDNAFAKTDKILNLN